MNEETKRWLKAAGIRAGKTAAQVALSMLTVGQAFMDVDWPGLISVAAVAAVVSILTSIGGLPEVGQKELYENLLEESEGDEDGNNPYQ